MDNHLLLLVSATIVKMIILVILGYFLYKKWNQQERKYYSDFPFLSAMTFFTQTIVKIFDIVMYIAGRNLENENFYTEQGWAFFAKFRMVFSPLLSCGFILILLLNIWLQEKKKLRNSIGITWFVGHIIGILWISNHSQYLSILGLFASPVLFFSVITFTITYIQKKLPMINSLSIAIGYFLLTLCQIIRPMWKNYGGGVWGLTWVGELVELISFLIIAYGFMTYSSFYKKNNSVVDSVIFDSTPIDTGF